MANLIEETFEILQKLGSGQGGTVYLAYHKRLDKKVVLKEMKPKAQRLLNVHTERDILKNLRHQYLPTVLDYFEIVNDQGEKKIYTVMDFIPGNSFSDLLSKGVRFTQAQVVKYTKQLCEAVAYLHRQNPPILHGDIKPANVMLTPEDNICLIDFNVSGAADKFDAMAFTRGYVSPEQYFAALQNQRNRMEAAGVAPPSAGPSQPAGNGSAPPKIDQRSDIYSIGATAYCLLLAQNPAFDFRKQVPIAKQDKKVFEGLAYVIDKAMQLQPQDRFQSASEMLHALENIGKKSSAYRRLFWKEVLFCTVFILLAAVSAVTAYFGYHTVRTERATTFYDHALELYDAKQYDEGLQYILTEALADKGLYDDEMLGGLNYLAAECCFETEEYESALSFYEKAIEYDPANAEYYCNYAITLSNLGKTSRAAEVIEEAIALGLTEDNLCLMRGELAVALGNAEEAEAAFRECLRLTDDPYVRSRAYLLCSSFFAGTQGYEQNAALVRKNVELLEDAEKNVGDSYLPIVLERLAEAYDVLGNADSDPTYYHRAVETYQTLLDLGWKTYANYMNLASVYGELQEFENSRETYLTLLDEFGERYEVYKFLAFLELEVQMNLPIENRNYDQFATYHDSAFALYDPSKQQDADTEMQLLQEAYQAIIDGGWIQKEGGLQ